MIMQCSEPYTLRIDGDLLPHSQNTEVHLRLRSVAVRYRLQLAAAALLRAIDPQNNIAITYSTTLVLKKCVCTGELAASSSGRRPETESNAPGQPAAHRHLPRASFKHVTHTRHDTAT